MKIQNFEINDSSSVFIIAELSAKSQWRFEYSYRNYSRCEKSRSGCDKTSNIHSRHAND